MRLITAFLIGSVVFSAGLTAQEPAKQAPKMYKWVDENGTVHYSAKPVDEAAAQEVEIRKGPSTPSVPPVEPIANPEEVARCAQLRKNLALLESNEANLEVSENGKVRPMRAEERAPQIEATRTAIARCDSVPPPQ